MPRWLRDLLDVMDTEDPRRCYRCFGTLPPDRPDACTACGPTYDPNLLPEPARQPLTTAWSVKGPLLGDDDPFAARPIGRLIAGVLWRPFATMFGGSRG